MLKNIINIFLFFALGTISHDLHAQLLENSLFKIYRSEFIAGTVTQFRLNSDSTYHIKAIEIHCSLCDQKQLTKMINSKGRSEEHTSELQSRPHLVCRLLLEK